ncbi:hypothetical protein GCM10023079_36300 [Streptomyces chitinivorans]
MRGSGSSAAAGGAVVSTIGRAAARQAAAVRIACLIGCSLPPQDGPCLRRRPVSKRADAPAVPVSARADSPCGVAAVPGAPLPGRRTAGTAGGRPGRGSGRSSPALRAPTDMVRHPRAA